MLRSPATPSPPRLLALETFTVFEVSSLISFSIFPLCPRQSLCTKLLVGKSGRVCFSRCLRCPRESPPPGADSQSNSPGNSPMLCFLGFKTSGWKLSLRVDLEVQGWASGAERGRTNLSLPALVSALTKETDNHWEGRADFCFYRLLASLNWLASPLTYCGRRPATTLRALGRGAGVGWVPRAGNPRAFPPFSEVWRALRAH